MTKNNKIKEDSMNSERINDNNTKARRVSFVV